MKQIEDLENHLNTQRQRLEALRRFDRKMSRPPKDTEFVVVTTNGSTWRVWRVITDRWQWTSTGWSQVTRSGTWGQFLDALLAQHTPAWADVYSEHGKQRLSFEV